MWLMIAELGRAAVTLGVRARAHKIACDNVGRAPLDSSDNRDATGTSSFITTEGRARHGSGSTGGLGDSYSWGAAGTSSCITIEGRDRHGGVDTSKEASASLLIALRSGKAPLSRGSGASSLIALRGRAPLGGGSTWGAASTNSVLATKGRAWRDGSDSTGGVSGTDSLFATLLGRARLDRGSSTDAARIGEGNFIALGKP